MPGAPGPKGTPGDRGISGLPGPKGDKGYSIPVSNLNNLFIIYFVTWSFLSI